MAPKVGSVQSDPTHCWRVATLTPLPRAPLFLTPKSDPRDPVAISFREPYVAVGTGGDPSRVRVGGDAPAVLGDHPGRRDLPDRVAAAALFREPDVAVGPGGKEERGCTDRDSAAVLGNHPGGRDHPAPVGAGFRAAQYVVGSGA